MKNGSALPVVAVLLACACAVAAVGEEDMPLSDLVPAEIGGWRTDDADGLFDGEEIFRYMDGAGEVYMSYGFRRLFVRQFLAEGGGGGEEPVTVELFDMGTPSEAFGVFTRGREGEGGADAGIGQGSEYRSGYLIFWKGSYFATVYALEETPASREAVFALARAIADAVAEEGPLPELVGLLPGEGIVERSVRFFHLYTCLNFHYFVADENILGLDLDTDAALAEYGEGEGRYTLLLIRYPDAERARGAQLSFRHHYLPEAGLTGIARLEDDKWTGVRLVGRCLLIVFDAATADEADAAMEAAAANIEREGGGI